MRGIDPRTSCMQSERSTIWATSLYFSSFKLASERNSSNISFLFVTRCQIFSHYLQKQTRIVESSKMFQRCGASTPYLSHAKRALYHLRYIPVLFKLRVSFWTKFMKNSFPFVTSCQFLPNITNWKTELSNPKNVLEMQGVDPRTSRMLSERSTIWATSPQWFCFVLASQNNSWKISIRFVTSCQFLPIIGKYKRELSNPQKCFGGCGSSIPVPLTC